MTRAAKERSWAAGVLLAALLAGLAGGASSAEASIPRGEPRGVLLEQPVPLLEQPPLLSVPAGEPVDMATTGGEPLPLFGPGPASDGLFDGVRIPAVERFQAETRYRVIELEIEIRTELERLQTSERIGFALFGGGESRRGSPNRYYDPELGRFISADPLGYVDGPSMYGFARNSPVNYTDPMGLEASVSQKGHFIITSRQTGATRVIRHEWAQKHPSGVWFALIEEAEVSEEKAVELSKKAGIPLVPGYLPCGPGETCISAGPEDRGVARDVAKRVGAVPICTINGFANAVDRVHFGRGREIPCAIGPARTEREELIDQIIAMNSVILFAPRGTMGPRGTAGAISVADELVTVGEFRLSRTVSSHMDDLVKRGPFRGEPVRPYLESPHTIREIMRGGSPVPDPGGVPGALRWDVPGTFRGSQGRWQLVVDPNNTILHFNFVR